MNIDFRERSDFMPGNNKMIDDLIRHDGSHSPEKMLRDIAYALDQSAIVAITDQTGKILYVNELFTKIAQYSVEELVGPTIGLSIPDFILRHFLKGCGQQSAKEIHGMVKFVIKPKMALIIGSIRRSCRF